MKLLVVEDDPTLRQQLVETLKGHKFSVDQARDGEEALYLGREYPYDLAVVDLGLPKLDGVELIRLWRSEALMFPVLILTARGRWQDKVEGLDAGADDYLVKPFQMEELLARVHALIRRSVGRASSLMDFGALQINLSRKQVFLKGVELDLTAYEYNTLEYLASRPGQPVSKTELTDHLYAQDYDRDSNVIEVFIGRLRKKLDPDNTLLPIKTLRGRGYCFNLDVSGGSI